MKRRIKTIILSAALGTTLLVGGTLAYFADADIAENNFTIGKVTIDLQETAFKEGTDESTNLVPGQEVKKNPTIKNTGINDAFVFMQVTVPTDTIITSMADGSRCNNGLAAETQLFSYALGSDWTLVTNSSVSAVTGGETISVVNRSGEFGIHSLDTKTGKGTVTYTYAYTGSDKSTLKAVAAGETTTELFKAVRFVNAVEDQGLEDTELDIDVTGYAIQSEYLNSGDITVDGNNLTGTSDPASVWKIVSNQAPTADDRSGEDASTDAE